MSAPITTSARAPEAESSQTSLNEPSMEDILASIRRIIAEDQSNSLGRSGIGGLTRRIVAPPQPSAAEPAPVLDDEQPAALELGVPPQDADAHTSLYEEMPEERYVSAADTPHSFEAESRSEPAAVGHQAAPAFETEHSLHTDDSPEQDSGQFVDLTSEAEPEPLMSLETGASISSSFQSLAETVMLQDPGLIERVMRESLRPLLKAWLDDHLPSIVERLVRTEIERVARGGRGRNS